MSNSTFQLRDNYFFMEHIKEAISNFRLELQDITTLSNYYGYKNDHYSELVDIEIITKLMDDILIDIAINLEQKWRSNNQEEYSELDVYFLLIEKTKEIQDYNHQEDGYYFQQEEFYLKKRT